MDLQLQDQHVLVTGGSRGIGLACARLFLLEGARVSIAGMSALNLRLARERLLADTGREPAAFEADLRDAAAAAAMVERVVAQGGEIDVLVNSAGAALRTPFEELTPEAWHAAMQAKFFTYVHVMDPIVKRMGARGRGAIVNVIGMGGKSPTPVHLPGGAANAALMLATAGLAAAWAPRGVRINAVNPGLTLTDRMAEGLDAEARRRGVSREEALGRSISRIPLGRAAQPQEIADTVVYLASPRAAYVCGAIVSMDGAVSPMVV